MVEQVTRRERYRQQTIDEIKTLAMEQVTDGGVATVSLNAIARTMAMSPGALYRYFDNRDELLAELAVAAYDSLADALERAVPSDGSRSARLTAVAEAYREWAAAAAEHLSAHLRKPDRLGRGVRVRADRGGFPAQHGRLPARAERIRAACR